MSGPGETHALRVLPRGRHAAPREVVAESQRERILVAMADAVADKGYANVAVADVIERAGVSRRSFYEHFTNKEDAFLAAYDAGVAGLLAAIAEAEEAATAHAPAGGGLLARARAGTEVYLQLLADNPAFARTFLIEVLGAGPAALERRDAVHARFAQRLADAHAAIAAEVGGLDRPADYVFRAAVGAIHELVLDCLLKRGARALPDLLGPVLEIELRLLSGGVPSPGPAPSPPSAPRPRGRSRRR
jgi:AcrR family transcriptional regulator